MRSSIERMIAVGGFAEVVNILKDSLANFKNNPVAINIYYQKDGMFKGRSVAPYRIERIGSVDRVYVYDSNYPGDDTRYITIDAANNRWAYDGWSGDVSTFQLDATKSYFPAAIDDTARSASIVTVSGDVDIQFTDEGGRAMVVGEGSIINQIPGAAREVTPQFNRNNPDMPHPVVYYLPASGTYTVDIQARATTTYTFTAYLDGVATGLEHVELTADSTDRITLAPGLRGLELRASGGAKDYCYILADDHLDDASRSFRLCTTSTNGRKASFAVTADNAVLTFRQTGASPYALAIRQTGRFAGIYTIGGTMPSGGTLTVEAGAESEPLLPTGTGWHIFRDP